VLLTRAFQWVGYDAQHLVRCSAARVERFNSSRSDRREGVYSGKLADIWIGPCGTRSAGASLRSAGAEGASSAVQLMAELLVLPPDMTVHQWVAHCGLDPRPFESGSSVHRPVRISKRGNARLRAALYFPALTAMQYDRYVQAFADHLRARQCAGLQVVVAVMRKLLHAIFGMWKHASSWRGEKFFALASLQAAAVPPAA